MVRWFISKTVRQATAMRKHVHRILCAQRDILSPPAVGAVEAALAGLQQSVRSHSSKDALLAQMENLEKIANKWLKPYPNANWRENVEVLLVALAVAMGIRTFFLQPFKIPTGSMQPTLFGVTSQNLIHQPDFKIPTGLARVGEWFEGISYVDVTARTEGRLEEVGPPHGIKIWNILQTLTIGGKIHRIWFPPDFGQQELQARAGLQLERPDQKGEQVIRLKTQAGDHLFVDRLTYNFRKPRRGEIIVFATAGTRIQQQDQFYIKRLVGLGGETLSLEKDYDVLGAPVFGTVPVGHLIVNGRPISAADPHFANVYSFPDAARGAKTFRYHENHYCGHALLQDLSGGDQIQVGPGHYYVMGDNTLNSADSRYWGDVPGENVIGKSFFVYWPITTRFGWGHR
jgi:signal peptidase I